MRRQPLQRTTPIPNKSLKEIIDRINLVPHRKELVPLVVKSADFGDDAEPSAELISQARQNLNDSLGNLPEAVQRYIWQNDREELYWPLRRYEGLVELQKRFDFLLSLTEVLMELETDLSIQIETPKSASNWFAPFPPRSIRLDVSPEGHIQLAKDEIAAAFEGVDMRRIRRCVDCQNIYWLGRSDQKCCSDECHGRLRVRRWREKRKADPEAFKERRKENAIYKAKPKLFKKPNKA